MFVKPDNWKDLTPKERLAKRLDHMVSAAVAYRVGLCDSAVIVHMPGGAIAIRLSPTFAAVMTGPVTRVCEGVMDPEMFKNIP